jgi:hypothetical protein
MIDMASFKTYKCDLCKKTTQDYYEFLYFKYELNDDEKYADICSPECFKKLLRNIVINKTTSDDAIKFEGRFNSYFIQKLMQSICIFDVVDAVNVNKE